MSGGRLTPSRCAFMAEVLIFTRISNMVLLCGEQGAHRSAERRLFQVAQVTIRSRSTTIRTALVARLLSPPLLVLTPWSCRLTPAIRPTVQRLTDSVF